MFTKSVNWVLSRPLWQLPLRMFPTFWPVQDKFFRIFKLLRVLSGHQGQIDQIVGLTTKTHAFRHLKPHQNLLWLWEKPPADGLRAIFTRFGHGSPRWRLRQPVLSYGYYGNHDITAAKFTDGVNSVMAWEPRDALTKTAGILPSDLPSHEAKEWGFSQRLGILQQPKHQRFMGAPPWKWHISRTNKNNTWRFSLNLPTKEP